MKKEKYMKDAKTFMGEGFGYIHSEMKNGKAPELIMGGDILAIMWQVCGILNRISEITGMSFEDVAGMTITMPSLGGYGNLRSMVKDDTKKVYVGDDWDEQWRQDKEKEIKREANQDNLTLAFNLAEMEKRNTSLNNQMVDLKKKHTKEIKAKNEEIKALNKEILVLEHRLKEMAEQRMWGREDESV